MISLVLNSYLIINFFILYDFMLDIQGIFLCLFIILELNLHKIVVQLRLYSLMVFCNNQGFSAMLLLNFPYNQQ